MSPEHEAAMGETRRNPGDAMGVAIGKLRDELRNPLGHHVVHGRIGATFLVAPFHRVDEIAVAVKSPPWRHGVAASIEQAEIVTGRGR
jgi:hypothetical protein